MKLLKGIAATVILILTLLSCEKDDVDVNLLSLLDSIPAQKYYQTDIFEGINSNIYGQWEVIGTSGGLAGGGYPQDFDHLLVKPNAIFGIVRNDSLISTGNIEIVDDPGPDLLIQFNPEEDPNDVNIELLRDNVKFVKIQSDTLHLIAPCCDRFDTHFKRVE